MGVEVAPQMEEQLGRGIIKPYEIKGDRIYLARVNIAKKLQEETGSEFIFSLNEGHSGPLRDVLPPDIFTVVPIAFDDTTVARYPHKKTQTNVGFIVVNRLTQWLSEEGLSEEEDKRRRSNVFSMIGLELSVLNGPIIVNELERKSFDKKSHPDIQKKRRAQERLEIAADDIDEFKNMQIAAAREIACAALSSKLLDTSDATESILNLYRVAA